MLSDNILTILENLKTKPNGEWRNKVISHLKDAYAASIVMDHNDSTFGLECHTEADDGQKRHSFVAVACTCGVGFKNYKCPVHSNQFR